MATRMQQRRGTAEQWTDADPILAAGEIGFETDTNQFKIGDGVNAWSDLSYFKNLEDLGGSLDDYVPVALVGEPEGVASLDATGKIPSSQIPDLVGLDTEIASAVSAAVADLVDGAPAALDTLNEIATLIGDGSSIAGTLISNIAQLDTVANELGTDISNIQTDLGAAQTDISSLEGTVGNHTTTLTDIAGNISTLSSSVTDHIPGTLDVHGIADTAALATMTYAETQAATAQSSAETNAAATADTKIATHNDATTNVHGIANTANLATTSDVSTAVSDHNADTTNVHGIADTAQLALLSDVSAVTAASLGLGNVDNTSDADKPVSTATVTAIATAKSEAIAEVTAVIDGAPNALNTLNELAAALGDDENFASTITTSLAAKVDSYTPITQKSESYTLSTLDHRDDLIEMGSSSALTLTIPLNSSIAYPVGTSLDILQTGTGQVTIAGAAGVTVNATPGLKLRTQWSSATLFKRAENTWVVYGDLMA